MTPPLVSVQELWFRYDDGPPALRGVSLEIGRGEWVAVLGCNGSGKSTLVKHFNGLLKPWRGRVLVEGVDTRRRQVGEWARLIAYLPQHPDRIIFSASVWEEVAFAPRLQGVSGAELERRVNTALEALGLRDAADVPPAALGYGLRRKVALAAVLAQEPALLILDEPTNGLDAGSARDFLEVVAQRHRQGTAVVLITHDLELAAQYAGRAVLMQAGEIAADGPARAVLGDAALLRKAGLEPLPVTHTAHALREAGLAGLPADLLLPEEFAEAYLRAAAGGGEVGQ